MLDCFLSKRKMFDYIDGTLTPRKAEKLKIHLQHCLRCRKAFSGMEAVVKIASEKKPPSFSEDFWKQFDRDLNAKLDAKLWQKLSPRKKIVLAPFFILPRPALVAVSLSIIVLVIGLHLLYPTPYIRQARMPQDQESSLVNDADLLDEISQENGIAAGTDEDYTAEIETLYLLDPSSIEQMG